MIDDLFYVREIYDPAFTLSANNGPDPVFKNRRPGVSQKEPLSFADFMQFVCQTALDLLRKIKHRTDQTGTINVSFFHRCAAVWTIHRLSFPANEPSPIRITRVIQFFQPYYMSNTVCCQLVFKKLFGPQIPGLSRHAKTPGSLREFLSLVYAIRATLLRPLPLLLRLLLRRQPCALLPLLPRACGKQPCLPVSWAAPRGTPDPWAWRTWLCAWRRT